MPDVIGDRYRLVGLLGRGAMSDVYRALDEASGTEVALKLVRSGDPELARRLAQEAKALEGFDHPGLVRLRDTGVSGDQAYLVMDLVEGPNLAEALRGGPLGTREAARLGASLAEALAYVHERGIVHRDVKPANVLLTRGGEPRLGDFGIARILGGAALTATGTTLGTTAYMAPEQLQNHQVGPAADTWSLGLVLLECLTGERVYEGSASEVVARRMAAGVTLPPDLPPAWRLLLSGMLEVDPGQRLGAPEVASLLGTPAFEAPWAPPPAEEPTAAMAAPAEDLTAAMAPPAGDLAGATVVDAGGGLRQRDGGTELLSSGHSPATPRLTPLAPGRPTRWGRPAIALLTILAVVLVLFLTLRSSPVQQPTIAPSASARPSPTPTALTVPTALAALNRDLASGVSAGTVDAAVAQSISSQAAKAVTDQAAGNLTLATNDLSQAAAMIAQAVQNNTITAGAPTLQSDLSSLATALGLGAVGAPPSLQPASPAGHGPRKGKR